MIECNFEFKRNDFLLSVNFETESKNIGLSGNSGSGKTTLLHLIAGTLKADKGKLIVNNQTLFDSNEKINIPIHKRKIAFVFQNSNLFPHLNVKKNLEYGYKLLKPAERKFSVDEIIDYFKINDLLEKYPQYISGGEKQRVAIASAILSSPEMVLFDEPVNSLDAHIKDIILNYIKDSFAKFDIPMIYVSHDKREINQLCNYFINIKKYKENDLHQTKIFIEG